MPPREQKSGFIRFLKDEKFIEWKLFPTEESQVYWDNYLQKNAHEEENIRLAEEHFRNIKLSAHTVSTEEKNVVLQRLEKSIRDYHRKKKIYRLLFSAAASVAILIGVLVYTQFFSADSGKAEIASTDYFVGNELDSQEIQLITQNGTSSFQENIDIAVTKTGVVQVKAEQTGIEEIRTDKSAMNKLVVPYGKRSKIQLSDGTNVWLNSGSVLEFPAQFQGDNREILLVSGELYLEVAPDKKSPFVVQTSDFDVKVYGTVFNVSAYAEAEQSVVLVEGSVGLLAKNRGELFIKPGEQAIYSENGAFSTQKVDVEKFTSWRNGYLLFDNAPIAEVLQQIGRCYNLSFNLDQNVSLKGKTCTGTIILSDNLDDVMTTVALLSSLKYKRDNKQILITNPK